MELAQPVEIIVSVILSNQKNYLHSKFILDLVLLFIALKARQQTDIKNIFTSTDDTL